MLFKKRHADLVAELEVLGFDKSRNAAGEEEGYGYLLDMPLRCLTFEHVEKLRQDRDAKAATLAQLLATSPEDLWLRDLDEVEACWNGDYKKECGDMIPTGTSSIEMVAPAAAPVAVVTVATTAPATAATTVAATAAAAAPVAVATADVPDGIPKKAAKKPSRKRGRAEA